MPKLKASSSVQSEGGSLTSRRRGSRSAHSPQPTSTSGKLTTAKDELKDKNLDSFLLTPRSSRLSVLSDKTDIEETHRKSWWKNLHDNSRNIMEALESQVPDTNKAFEKIVDIDVLSQEKNNVQLELSDSSMSMDESVKSIVLPERKLFNQNNKVLQKKFGQLVGVRENLTKLHNASLTQHDKTINAGTKNFFQHTQRSKQAFPAALLNISSNKTIDKTNKNIAAVSKIQTRNIFGSRVNNKQKNIFSNFILTESDDEVSDTEPKIFGFQKQAEMQPLIWQDQNTSDEDGEVEVDEIHTESNDLNVSLEKGQCNSESDNDMIQENTYAEMSHESEAESDVVNENQICESHEINCEEEILFIQNQTAIQPLACQIENTSHETKVAAKQIGIKNNEENYSQCNKNYENKTDESQMYQENVLNMSNERQGQLGANDKQNYADQKYKETENRLAETSITQAEILENYDVNSNIGIENNVKNNNAKENSREEQENEINHSSKHAEVYQSQLANVKVDQIQVKDNILEASKVVYTVSDSDKFSTETNISKGQEYEVGKQVEQNQIQTDNYEDIHIRNIENKSEENKNINNENIGIHNSRNENKFQDNDEQDEVNESEADNDVVNQSNQIDNELEDNEKVDTVNNDSDQNTSQEQDTEGMEVDQNQSDSVEVDESQEIDYELDESENEDDEHEKSESIQSEDSLQSETLVNNSKPDDKSQSIKRNSAVDEIQGVENNSEVDKNQDIESSSGVKESQDVECDNEVANNQVVENNIEVKSQDVENEQDTDDMDIDEVNVDVIHKQNQEEMEVDDDSKEKSNVIGGEEIIEKSRNITHKSIDNNKNGMPEVVLHGKTSHPESFVAEERDVSFRKSRTLNKDLNIRPSLAPARESIGLADGTNGSSAEGSAWDSHRTTRKTLRQTFGRDFTPRKSLRALVMEKSAKLRENLEILHSETTMHPQANSTEYPVDSFHEDNPSVESDHEESRRERLAALDIKLQKIRDRNLEKKLKLEEETRNRYKTQSDKNIEHLFKVPTKPPPRKLTTSNKPKKQQIANIFGVLPPEVIDDMKYKPPKRFKPSNASWITKRLYKFLESKLEPKYDYRARVRAEKLVETIYHFTKDLRRQKVASIDSVKMLKHEFARLNIVKTHFEFYEFFQDFMPREVRVKVVPDIVNRIALPRHGVFADIL